MLTFKQFSATNLRRALRWHKNGINEWSLNDWIAAAVGEFGEMANVAKKIRRHEMGMPGNKETRAELQAMLAEEIGGTVIYLGLLAERAGIDLETAVVETFNAKSEEMDFPERLP